MAEKLDFIGLVQDEDFVRLVVDASNPDETLKELIQQNPKNRDKIRYAFEFIRVNLSNKTKMEPEDYQNILDHIQDYSNRKSSTRILNFIPRLRIAAMILVIIAVGSLVAYYQFSEDSLTRFAQLNVANSDQAVIVLSDGTKQALKNNNSFVDYKSNNGEVVVRKDSNEEIINNKNISTNEDLNQIVVPFGQHQKILLSDGTLVHLNAGSKLVFPVMFSGKTREVYLKGEGFFEVYKNAKVPFIVRTDQINIKVLGTKFNVSAYEDEHVTSAVLVEGKVNVSEKNKFFGNNQYTLTPGKGYFFTKSEKQSVVKEVDVNDYILWKDGLYNFKNLPLSIVLNRVEKYYNLIIKVEDDNLTKTLVSGKLVLSDSITDVMEYLSKTMECRYIKMNDGNFIILKE